MSLLFLTENTNNITNTCVSVMSILLFIYIKNINFKAFFLLINSYYFVLGVISKLGFLIKPSKVSLTICPLSYLVPCLKVINVSSFLCILLEIIYAYTVKLMYSLFFPFLTQMIHIILYLPFFSLAMW